MNKIYEKFIRYYRYAWYTFRVFFLERPKGLDFHLNNVNVVGEGNMGYSLTPESHLNEIFTMLNVDNDENNNFIDVGCGKGFVLKKAVKKKFKRVSGIEIDNNLVAIAKKNMKILKLEKRVSIFHEDAVEFDYTDYNVIFFYNPFSEEVMAKVIKNILNSLEEFPRKLTIIYANPTQHSLFMESKRFKVSKRLYCNLKRFETFIYQCEDARIELR